VSFIKAIREDRLPNFFEEAEVNNFYNLISKNPLHLENKMNFETWCFFFNLHRLFQKYSKARKLHLNQKELVKLLSDKFTPNAIVNAIDLSLTNFKSNEYKEASLYLQRKVPQESEFYYSFKQPPESHFSKVVTNLPPIPRVHTTMRINKKGNNQSRGFFFSVMSDVDNKFWTKDNYYLAFTLSNLFIAMTSDKRFIVNVKTILEELPKFYDLVFPAINQSQRRNLAYYKNLPPNIYLDLLNFLEVETYLRKLKITKMNNLATIPETLVKMVTRDFGMVNIQDILLDVASKGYDKLKRRIYDVDNVIRALIVVQAVAAEKKRNANTQKENKIKKNNTKERKYPIGNRRLNPSPLAN